MADKPTVGPKGGTGTPSVRIMPSEVKYEMPPVIVAALEYLRLASVWSDVRHLNDAECACQDASLKIITDYLAGAADWNAAVAEMHKSTAPTPHIP